MGQPPHSELIPVASAAPPPAAYAEIKKQEKQDTQHTTPLFGKQYTPEGVPIAQEKQYTQYTTPPTFGKKYTPEGVPIAQGQPAYYARGGIPGGRAVRVVKEPHRPSRKQDRWATPNWILLSYQDSTGQSSENQCQDSIGQSSENQYCE